MFLKIAFLVLMQAMSDSQAAVLAHNIWGDLSFISTSPRRWTDVQWSRDVGFASPGCATDFTIAGHGYNTWEAAFASAPVGGGISGPYSGIRQLAADSPGVIIPPPVSAEPVPGITSHVQFIVDGALVGPKIATGGILPWHVQYAWDTATVPDGIHAVCAQLSHPDGSITRTKAAAISIKQ